MRLLSLSKFLLCTSAVVVSTTVASTLGACSGQLNQEPDAARSDAGPSIVTLFPDAAALPGQSECKVTVTRNLPITGQTHVAMCSPVSYATNPPSSGDHWPQWAAYRTYDVPVSREMYVHNLEHGAVVIGYRCEQAECPDVVRMIKNAASKAFDSLCSPAPRIIVTQDMLLTTPLAATAWGATYTATCLDEGSLVEFINTQIGKGSEPVCMDGLDIQSAGDPCAFLKDASADAAPILDVSAPSMDAGVDAP